MKKMFLITTFLFFITIGKTKAQDTIAYQIASYDATSDMFSFEFGNNNVEEFLESAAELLGYSATPDTFFIDDGDPRNESPIAYFTIEATISETDAVSLHFFLTKEIDGNITKYYINNNWENASKAAECKSMDGCSGCKKFREHWYSAATGCDCNRPAEPPSGAWCQFTSGDSWSNIIGVATLLVTVFGLFN